MRISIQINTPRFIQKLLGKRCKHELVSIETEPFIRYGTKTFYIGCLKCGKTMGECQRNCHHQIDYFGICQYCHKRLKNFEDDHIHEWIKEPDTDDKYCEVCGCWHDEI